MAGFKPATFCSPHKTILFRGDPEDLISRYPRFHSIGQKKRTIYARYIILFFGASGRIRTGDLLITNQLLYLLSHTSNFRLLLGLYQTMIKNAIHFFILNEKICIFAQKAVIQTILHKNACGLRLATAANLCYVHLSVKIDFVGELGIVEFFVRAAGSNECVMRALFHDFAAVDDHDFVRFAHGG